jgi:hypothetical protein
MDKVEIKFKLHLHINMDQDLIFIAQLQVLKDNKHHLLDNMEYKVLLVIFIDLVQHTNLLQHTKLATKTALFKLDINHIKVRPKMFKAQHINHPSEAG